MTSSNGQGGKAARIYRKQLEDLIGQGKWRQAMLKEILDVRRIANEVDPRKYNEAMQEMMEYFKCLGKNGLLK